MSSTSAKLKPHWGQIIYEVEFQTLKQRQFEFLAAYNGAHNDAILFFLRFSTDASQ